MATSKAKFAVPVIEDEDEFINVESHFQPGKIMEEIKSSPVKSVSSTSSEVLSVEHLGCNDTEFSKATYSKNFSSNTTTSLKPSTSFTSAFSHLKDSKFYEPPPVKDPFELKKIDPVKPMKSTYSSTSIIVNPRQRGNPLLKSIRNVPWEYGEIEPDYIMGKTTCALFLSMRYHNQYPNYIHDRLKSLGKSFQLRVLLVQVDVIDSYPPLKELSMIAVLADCTLMLAWSSEEAGMYLETYKSFENKSADLIMEKQESDTYSQLIDCLTTVRSINRTDAVMLISTFGSLENVIQATPEQLSICPGMGPLKANRLHEALHKPIRLKRNEEGTS